MGLEEAQLPLVPVNNFDQTLRDRSSDSGVPVPAFRCDLMLIGADDDDKSCFDPRFRDSTGASTRSLAATADSGEANPYKPHHDHASAPAERSVTCGSAEQEDWLDPSDALMLYLGRTATAAEEISVASTGGGQHMSFSTRPFMIYLLEGRLADRLWPTDAHAQGAQSRWPRLED